MSMLSTSSDHDAYVLRLQRIIDAAGGVPADIPLWARIDCLAKQRDGVAPIPSSPWGRVPA